MSIRLTDPPGSAGFPKRRSPRPDLFIGSARRFAGIAGLTLVLLVTMFYQALAAAPVGDAFQRTWERPDEPVRSGQVSRTWMWGPEAFTNALQESYGEAPDGRRAVQYFDKARMEDNGFRAAEPWDITNGLLVVELMTGQMQVGDGQFEQREPALVNVAGDADDLGGPAYMTMGRVSDEPGRDEGSQIIERLDRSGKLNLDESLAGQGVTAAHYVHATGHTVASPFWTFMNSSDLVYVDGQLQQAQLFSDPFYATGLPVTEAYWAEVKVGGVYKDVLMQCFERRCLTYTPDNSEGWQVEAGNVGRHYYAWRYGADGGEQPTPEPTPDPSSTPGPDPSPTPEPDPSPTPEPTPDPTTEPLPEPVLEYTLAAALGGDQERINAFDKPYGVAITTDGTILVADKGSERIQEFSAAGFSLGGYGGDGEVPDPVDMPEDIEIDAEGRIWVLDRGNSRIVRLDENGAVVKAIGQVGKPNLRLRDPSGFTIGPDGNFYVADTANKRVKVYKPDGNFLMVVGEPGNGDGQFQQPSDVAVHDSGNIFVADQETSRIHMFGPDGAFIFAWDVAGSGEEEIMFPTALEIDEVGRLYIADLGNSRVQVFTTDAEYIRTIGAEGTEPGQLRGPVDIVADNAGYVYIVGRDDRYVHKFTDGGEFVDRWSGDQRANFERAKGVDVDDAGRIYVTDDADPAIQIFDAAGEFVDLWANEELDSPRDVALAGEFAYVVNRNSVVKLTIAGEVVTSWGSPGTGDGELNEASGIDVDGQGNVYITDLGNYRVQKFDADGAFITAWGELGVDPGEFTTPYAIAVHGDEVFVLDPYLYRVQVFDLDGNYLRGWETMSTTFLNFGIAVDSDGYVYLTRSDLVALVDKFTPTGELVTTVDRPDPGPLGPDARASGVAVTDQNTIYLTTDSPSRLVVLTAVE